MTGEWSLRNINAYDDAANRGYTGFMDSTAQQSGLLPLIEYLQEEYRARVNAFFGALICAAKCGIFYFGALGELLGYRLTMTVTSILCVIACWLTVGRHKKDF